MSVSLIKKLLFIKGRAFRSSWSRFMYGPGFRLTLSERGNINLNWDLYFC